MEPHRAGSSSGKYDETDFSRIPDLAKFPELVWLDRNQYAATMLYGARSRGSRFGWTGLVWGYFVVDRPPLARHVHDQLASCTSSGAACSRRRTRAATA